jgi:hypothetical protein
VAKVTVSMPGWKEARLPPESFAVPVGAVGPDGASTSVQKAKRWQEK